jgi:hypothetical protein
LKELLNYDENTGIFTWKVKRKGSGRRVGDVAGCEHMHDSGVGGNAKAKPLILIGIDYQLHRAHRLAWLYVHGKFPSGVIDHKNGIPTDNRIDNLRDSTNRINSQNIRNPQPFNATGILGVSIDKERGGFKSEIRLPDGKKKFLGRFDKPEDAHNAYLEAKRKYHEGCTI